MNKQLSKKNYIAAMVLTASVIALWGFAHRLYSTLLPGLGEAFTLSPARMALVRPAIVIGYVLMALPAAFVSRNLGYKIGVLFGLGTFAVGMFLVFPAIQQQSLAFFLISASVVGSGLAILEVTALPLIVFQGRPETAVQRLLIAEALSSFGGVLALYLGPSIQTHTLTSPTGASSLVALFSSVGALSIALAFIIELTRFPSVATARVAGDEHTMASFRPPLRLGYFRLAVGACFLILVAQIVLAAIAPLYSRFAMPSLTAAAAEKVLIYIYLALGVGRLAGVVLMRWIEPLRLTVAFAIACAASAAVSAFASGPLAIAGMIGIGFFTAILLPAIFAITMLRLGEMAKSGSAVLMFLVFGATGVVAFATIVAAPSILPVVMIVPALCYAGTVWFAIAFRRASAIK